MEKWMDGVRTKRCRNIASRLGYQCEKPKAHERDLDVVHKAGMFTWRDEPLFVWRDEPLFVGPLSVKQARFLNQMAPTQTPEPQFTVEHKAEAEVASPESQLTDWWLTQAEDEVARTVPKAIEYSATDLTDIGHDLARTAGREVSDEEAAELGVFFYLRGKMARWVGAVIAGQRVSDDTLFDIGVYVRMAQRIRQFGSWPGLNTDPVSAEDVMHSMCADRCGPNCTTPPNRSAE